MNDLLSYQVAVNGEETSKNWFVSPQGDANRKDVTISIDCNLVSILTLLH